MSHRRPGPWLILALLGALGFPVCQVPAGSFRMGTDKSQFSGERPAHDPTLGEYWIDRYPVTNRQFAAFARETGLEGGAWGNAARGRDDHPVVYVSWAEASASPPSPTGWCTTPRAIASSRSSSGCSSPTATPIARARGPTGRWIGCSPWPGATGMCCGSTSSSTSRPSTMRSSATHSPADCMTPGCWTWREGSSPAARPSAINAGANGVDPAAGGTRSSVLGWAHPCPG